MPFRLLDLPLELRRAIYAWTAAPGLAVSFSSSVPPPTGGDVDDPSVFAARKQIFHEHRSRRARTAHNKWNRLTLLRASKQVCSEAAEFFPETITMDLRYVYLDKNLEDMNTFSKVTLGRLDTIRHLELEFITMELLFLADDSQDSDVVDSYVPTFGEAYGSSSDLIGLILDAGTAMNALKEITVYPTTVSYGLKTTMDLGSRIAHLLADPSLRFRERLDHKWPKLENIRTNNRFGGERLCKVDGRWELAYTKEKLPTDVWPQDDGDECELESHDRDTHLIVSSTMRYLGPTEAGEVSPWKPPS